MDNYVFLVDSACDLPADIIKKYDIELLGLKCIFNNKEYIENLDMPLTYKEFYEAIRNGALPTTSQANTYSFYEVFEKYAKENIAVIYPAFSSALSGTINSAQLAKNQILEEYPNADITILDTKCASLGYGLLVTKAAQLKNNGATKEETIKYLNETAPQINHIVLLDDLNYLKRGGRLSGTAAALGGILNLKPLVKMNEKGELINFSKVKGRRKGISALFDALQNSSIDINSQKLVAISHSDCLEDAEKLAEMIREKYNVEVLINYIGCVIGSHTGAGTLALFFLNNKR